MEIAHLHAIVDANTSRFTSAMAGVEAQMARTTGRMQAMDAQVGRTNARLSTLDLSQSLSPLVNFSACHTYCFLAKSSAKLAGDTLLKFRPGN